MYEAEGTCTVTANLRDDNINVKGKDGKKKNPLRWRKPSDNDVLECPGVWARPRCLCKAYEMNILYGEQKQSTAQEDADRALHPGQREKIKHRHFMAFHFETE